LLVEGRSIFAARFPAPVSCISNSYAKTKIKHLLQGMALHQHPMIDLGVLGSSGQSVY